jgi:hypothetical protein
MRRMFVASFAALLMWSTASPVLASGILPANNPKSNIAPDPNFLQSGPCSPSSSGWSCRNPCVTSSLQFPAYTTGSACTAYVLKSIAVARKAEGLSPMVVPTNWSSLTPPEQLFVLADLERTDRGLPPYLGLNDALSDDAQHSAWRDTDPGVARGFSVGLDQQGYFGMGGAWSTGFTTLSADYFWMYNDGWGGSAAATSNLSCTSASAPACWAHRDELLGYDPKFNPGVGLYCRTCEMGTGYALTYGFSSYVDLVELPAGNPPPMTFTWANNVVPYLPKPTTTGSHKKDPASKSHPHRTTHHAAWHGSTVVQSVPSLCLKVGSKHPWEPFACRSHDTRRSTS